MHFRIPTTDRESHATAKLAKMSGSEVLGDGGMQNAITLHYFPVNGL